ncbi:exonuclease SbcCD subunit D [Polycladidibacter stylochi]|uniref:exonuclease SbcCD subunit D n=1 Tax=Polycladidibacter stylochi TaxID=1807766 RepID=UPI000831CD79|nr:exonuclease SbcCD subunit D [Pseudovibrio stylochi]
MAFKILHTADWHIGQTLNGWTRSFEHRQFFAELKELVCAHNVDAVIVAGDVFDNQNPSAQASRMLYEALADLHHVRPHLQVVLVAGNHDPAGRLEAPGVLFERIGVHVCGGIRRDETGVDLSRHLVSLKDKNGVARACVLALPFPRAADLPGLHLAHEGEEGSPVVAAVRTLYDDATQRALLAANGLPLIATGHLHVGGAEESEGAERRILIGGEHAVPHSIFTEELAYVALGHLHKPQKVGRENIRYSGSPFPLSVAEQHYKHGLDLICFEDGASTPTLERLPLSRSVPFYRLGGSEGARLEDVPKLLEELPLDAELPVEQRPFVHVDLCPQVSSHGLKAQVEQMLEGFAVRGAGVAIKRKVRARAAQADVSEADSMAALAQMNPRDLFLQVFEEVHGEAASSVHQELFTKAVAENEQ